MEHFIKSKRNILLTASVVISLLFAGGDVQSQVVIQDPKPFMYALEIDRPPMSSVDELEMVINAQKEISEADQIMMKYWNAAYPSYRWHQTMMEISKAHKGHKNGGRVVILHLAIYDALVQTWKHKASHFRKAPCSLSEEVAQYGRTRDYSAFICEWSAAAGAAHKVIGYYFPDQTPILNTMLDEFKQARLQSGLVLPSDIAMGLDIGAEIAERYIEYAKTDRTDRMWEGEVPDDPTLWSGDPGKWNPMRRQWKPLTLESPDQFRPEPPPNDWTADMEELRRFNAENKTSDIAWKWKSAPVWDDLLERKILEYDLDPLAAAFSSALFHTARFDAMIAAWDGKFHYWGIRPFQYDPDFQPILDTTPNFPGYPAGHTTVAGSIATALSYLFPSDRITFVVMAVECSESRFEGGVHFRTDNEVGLLVGEKVGNQVINRFEAIMR